jgi:succinyl-diaminopimelate desuccinylase
VLEALSDYDSEIRTRDDELVGTAYATVTMFEAGTKENVIPESATITVDRRFLPEETATEVDAEISSLLEEVAAETGADVSWERTRTYESAAIDPDSPLANVFRKHSADVAGVSTEPKGVTASTDVRNFINDAGTEAITWGPGDITQAHTHDEHVDLAAASDGLDALLGAAREVLSGQIE